MSGKDDPTWVGEATYVGDATFAEDGDGGTSEVPLLAGRYRVGRLLGRGGTGQVHEALDVTTEERVAIKFVAQRSQSARRQLRQELTALRLLALPGVVRLHDDGEQGDQTYLVMDLLDGGGFDRLAGAWEGWKEQARALLEAVARVHFAGVHHLDLKPGNVLLDAEGRPVITDFGLARGRSVHNPEDAPREGTPRYMAPEQWRGEETTAATDLYAVGGIFWEMLAGRGLPSDPDARGLPVDCAPEEVRATVTAMLAEDPAQRPQTAVEVLEALFDVTAVLGPEELGLPEVAAGPEELEGLFDEDKPTFLHLARDAAKVLYELTGGERGKVRAELDRWVRAGLAWWNGSRVHIERPAIEQLQWGLDPESRRLAALARSQPEAALREGMEHALNLGRLGYTHRAIGILEALVPLASALGKGGPVCDALVAFAIPLQTSVLKSVLRHAWREQRTGAVCIARAALAIPRGEREAGLQWLGRAPADLSTILVEARDSLRVSLMQASSLKPRLASMLSDPKESMAEHRRCAGKAWLAYSDGAYQRATELYLASANTGDLRADTYARLNAVASAVEVPDLSAARSILTEVRRVVQRWPPLSVRARWLTRMVEYRAASELQPEPEWVVSAKEVHVPLSAKLAVLEAAIAWRTGDPRSFSMATSAARSFEEIGYAPGSILSRSLVYAETGGEAGRGLWAEARELPAEFAVQCLALLCCGGTSGHGAASLLRQALNGRVRRHWHLRLDVLSLAECAEMLQLELDSLLPPSEER